ncbi:MAG: hypothetical protein AB7V77_02150 [Candidatus Woesearchaeota archaeon]
MDIHITYETLFDLLRKERSLTELQPLNKDFWTHVLEYLAERQLESKNKKGLSETEKMRLQIENVKRIVKEIYERREKKITNIALNVIRTDASSFVDTQNMLNEEKLLFNELLIILKSYKQNILSNVFEGKEINLESLEQTKKNLASSLNVEIKHYSKIQEKKIPTPKTEEKQELVEEEKEEIELNEEGEEVLGNKTVNFEELENPEKLKIKFLVDVPKFLGQNKDVFGPFKKDDEATLPEKIASILIKKGKVEAV